MGLKIIPLTLVWFLLPFTALSQGQETGDTLDSSFEDSGSVLITNNGFAPIPAFSFEKPTVMAFLSFHKGRFGYQPDAALGLNGDLWMNNHWLRYYFSGTRRFNFRGGINLSLFFNHETTDSQEEIIKADRNITLEAAGDYQVSDMLAVGLMYRYNHAVDRGTISGHFIDLSANVSGVSVADNIALSLGPKLFYFDHIGDVDGLFVAIDASIGHEQLPLSISFQGVRRMWSNFSPSPVFQWNVGVQYVL